jgi:hypothetical protein
VREGFYYLWASEKFFYNIFIFRKITQTYLSLLALQRLLLNCLVKLLDFCPRNPYTVHYTSNKCCTDCLEFHAKILPRLYGKTQQYNALKTMPIPSKSVLRINGQYIPQFLCRSVRTVWIFSLRKMCPTLSSKSMPINVA